MKQICINLCQRILILLTSACQSQKLGQPKELRQHEKTKTTSGVTTIHEIKTTSQTKKTSN